METLSRVARIAAATALCAAATLAGATPNRGWTIQRLDGVNGDSSVANAVNNRGDVAGWSAVFDSTINSNRVHVMLWQNGASLDLGEGQAVDINERGTVLGSVAGFGMALYKDGAWQGVGIVGVPMGLNRFDDIAGWQAVNGFPRAFLFRGETLYDIGTFGGSSSAAVAVDDHGRAVGYAAVAGNASNHAFLYENGRMTDLGTLAGGRESRAAAINNHGVVVGEAWDPNGRPIPFVYDGVMRALFDLPGGAKAWAINDHGAVVGTMNSNQSFLWDDGVLTQLEAIPAVRAAGWTQLIPTGISDRGWITGMGLTNQPVPAGHMPWQAFVLKPR